MNYILYPISMAFITIVLRGSLNAVAAQFATAFFVVFFIKFLAKHKIQIRE